MWKAGTYMLLDYTITRGRSSPTKELEESEWMDEHTGGSLTVLLRMYILIERRDNQVKDKSFFLNPIQIYYNA